LVIREYLTLAVGVLFQKFFSLVNIA